MEGVAGMGALLNALLLMSVVTVPLALWKLIDIIIWLAHHVRWAG